MVNVYVVARKFGTYLRTMQSVFGTLNFSGYPEHHVELTMADQLDAKECFTKAYSFTVSDMNTVGRSITLPGNFHLHSISHMKCDGSLSYMSNDFKYQRYMEDHYWKDFRDRGSTPIPIGVPVRDTGPFGDVDRKIIHKTKWYSHIYCDGGYVDVCLHVMAEVCMTYFGSQQGLYAKAYASPTRWCQVFAREERVDNLVPMAYGFSNWNLPYPDSVIYREYAGSFGQFAESYDLYLEGYMSKLDWPHFYWDNVSGLASDGIICEPVTLKSQSYYENQIRAACLGKTPEELVLATAKTPWSDLAYEAYDSLNDQDGFAGNGVSFLKEIPEQLATIQSINESLKGVYTAIPKGKTIADICKAGSGLYLGIHYGLKLTLLDSQELVENYGSFANGMFRHRRLGSSRTVVSPDGGKTISTFTQYYTPHNSPWHQSSVDLQAFQEFLHQYDIEPSLENTWDLLPWTFVVDWFTHFGDLLSHLDKEVRLYGMGSTMDPYDLIGYTRSVKTILPLANSLPMDCASNSLTSVTYTRLCSDGGMKITTPPLSEPITPQRHWLEGATLVTQQIL